MAKILIVDDSPTMRRLVKSALAVEDHEFATAEDGQEGLNKFHSFAPDIVISDINMPQIDGIKMIQEMRLTKSKLEVPVVVLTTETSSELKEKIRRVGANSWIAKPFDDDVLRSVVNQVAG